MTGNDWLNVTINGARIALRDLAAWEDRRIASARRVLGLPPSQAPRDQQKAELLERKLAIGPERMHAHLRGRLRISSLVTRMTLGLSGQARRLSVCEIAVADGIATDFADWFLGLNRENDIGPLLDACPDHFVIVGESAVRQRVIETTGGSPLPGEFVIDFADQSGLATLADPAYPIQIAGTARLTSGLAIGGVRHQLKQEGAGFRVLLTVEFPRAVAPAMIRQHQWHLAVEFSNWLRLWQAKN
jgi:hypothetical protein